YLLFRCSRLMHPADTQLFPYTTLFRSGRNDPPREARQQPREQERRGEQPPPIDAEQRGRARIVREGAPGAAEARAAEQQQHAARSEEHTSELQSRRDLVCRLLLEKKNS